MGRPLRCGFFIVNSNTKQVSLSTRLFPFNCGAKLEKVERFVPSEYEYTASTNAYEGILEDEERVATEPKLKLEFSPTGNLKWYSLQQPEERKSPRKLAKVAEITEPSPDDSAEPVNPNGRLQGTAA